MKFNEFCEKINEEISYTEFYSLSRTLPGYADLVFRPIEKDNTPEIERYDSLEVNDLGNNEVRLTVVNDETDGRVRTIYNMEDDFAIFLQIVRVKLLDLTDKYILRYKYGAKQFKGKYLSKGKFYREMGPVCGTRIYWDGTEIPVYPPIILDTMFPFAIKTSLSFNISHPRMIRLNGGPIIYESPYPNTYYVYDIWDPDWKKKPIPMEEAIEILVTS